MDYPDVTHVLQVGLTDREQYIHRLGRTARAGKGCRCRHCSGQKSHLHSSRVKRLLCVGILAGGEGLLLLAPFEERSMMRDLSDMRIERMSPQSSPPEWCKSLLLSQIACAKLDSGICP
eukprot:4152162-Amphidinium_carterae.1